MTLESEPLDFTGERFTPECQREVWYEHYHRYALASRWCKGLRVLDAACGEGYGSALVSQSAAAVEGIDISEAAVAHAAQRYGHIQNLNFQVADCTSLPFADDEFDCITSFETLEHLEAHDQLLTEFKRVLKPGGFLAISSPDKAIYTDKYQTENEFHVKELYRDELESLISRHFKFCQLLGQKLAFHSAIWSVGDASDKSGSKKSGPNQPGLAKPGQRPYSAEPELEEPASNQAPLNRVCLDQISLDTAGTQQHSSIGTITQPAMYFIALCADAVEDLPPSTGQLWLFDDFEESVYRHYHGEIKHNIAAGGVIVDLEKQIGELKQQLNQQIDQPLVQHESRSWWQRLFGKS